MCIQLLEFETPALCSHNPFGESSAIDYDLVLVERRIRKSFIKIYQTIDDCLRKS